jgi:hypothetical protein
MRFNDCKCFGTLFHVSISCKVTEVIHSTYQYRDEQYQCKDFTIMSHPLIEYRFILQTIWTLVYVLYRLILL